MRHRMTVRCVAAGEVVTLHDAGKALALGDTGDIDPLAGGEAVDLEFGSGLQVGVVGIAQPKFDQRSARGHVGLAVVAGDGLGQQLRTALAVGDLHGTIPVALVGLDLRDAVREQLNHRDGHRIPGVREHASHSAFAADQPNCHLSFLDHRTRTAIGARRKNFEVRLLEVSEIFADALEWSWLPPLGSANLARCRVARYTCCYPGAKRPPSIAAKVPGSTG